MIIAFIGMRGSGKTLSMVKFISEKYEKGFNIFSNFELKLKENKKGSVQYLDKKFFVNYAESGLDIKNSVVAIDECHVFFDSRNAMLKRNKIFSKFVTQSRKRSVDLIYTTQDKSPMYFLKSGQVELRLRKLTDMLIFCECIKSKGHTFIVNSYCNQYGELLTKKTFHGDKYFSMYDTDQIIDIDFD